MTYFFILGNNPALSVAELKAIFPGSRGEILANHVYLLDISAKVEPQKLIRRLGGTIKFGLVGEEVRDFKKLAILERIKKIIEPILAGKTVDKDAGGKALPGKFNFGFSDYADSGKINFRELGMETKNYLKGSGINCRWVISKEKTLSSVVVEQNKLIGFGAEIVFIAKSKQVLVGRTLAVQPFKELSFRDYGRPTRDDLSGMLPPKLAQIMLNLAQAPPGGIILDPFCGSGTILTEAILMGYADLIGSDISEKAIADTNSNIQWIEEKFNIAASGINLRTFKISAADLSREIAPKSVDTIVTEPYLGPQRGQFDINEITAQLEKLYSDSLREFKKILKPGGKVVMIWPVFSFRERGKRVFKKIMPDIAGFEKNKDPLVYGREGQGIWREIVILQNS